MLTANGKAVIPGALLGKGGQGEVYLASSHAGKVFKKYSSHTLAKDPALRRRLDAMIAASPPERIEVSSKHMVLAWPEEVVFENSRLAGFLMSRVNMDTTVELHRITNPSDRNNATGANAWIAGFTWQYLVRASANLAHATHILHNAGVVIGDFNLKNVRVSNNALVTLIDCDSMQITDPATGERFFCPVVMPEFLPPELVGASLERTVRHPSSDLYALAIHLHQLLLEGEHPFRGIWKGHGDKPSIPELARDGMWTLRAGGKLVPRPSAIDAGLLPAQVLELFRRAFEDGATDPGQRPSAAEWRDALNDLSDQLQRCRTNANHWYVQSLPACPWCRHATSRAVQRPLPGAQAPTPYRAPAQPVATGGAPATPGRPTVTTPLSYGVASSRPSRPPGRVVAVGAAVAAALLFGGTTLAQAVGGETRDGGRSSSASDPETDGFTAQGKTTGNTDADGGQRGDEALSQARAIRDLLSSSGATRRSIQSAIADVSSCGNLAADAATFGQAAADRSSHRGRAAALDYSAVPNGTELRRVLVGALEASYNADVAYQAWANSLAGSCTRQAAARSTHLADATRSSESATSYKKEFVGMWNDVCNSYGWSPLQETDI
jgi:serine/threonine protein kinase